MSSFKVQSQLFSLALALCVVLYYAYSYSCDNCLMYQLFRDLAPWCEMDSLLFFPCVGIPTHFHGNLRIWRNVAWKLLLYYSIVLFRRAGITMVPVNRT